MTQRTRQTLLLLGAVALGVAIRLQVTWKQSPDCVYHLRRARFAVAHFPKTVVFDPFINFPDGGICIWPPLFDAALALPARLLGGAGASPALLEKTAFWVPIFFAAGAILAAGLAGAAVRRGWGPAAALFVAICPGHLQYSQFGHTDQHVAESFWGFLALAFFLRGSSVGRPRSPDRGSGCSDAAAGLCLAMAVLTWQGAIFWAPLFAGALAVSAFGTGADRAGRRAILVLGMPSAVTAAATAYWLSGRRVPFTYVSFGWFQPVFLAASFGFVCAAVAAAAGRSLAPRARAAYLLLAVAAAIPAALRGRDFLSMLAMGVRHLSSSSSGGVVMAGGLTSYSRQWLSQIVEYRPLFADGWDWPFGLLSFAFFLSPLAMVLWARRIRRGRAAARPAVLLLWGVFTLLFTLFQRRNVYYGALLGALSAVELSAWLSVRLRRKMSRTEAIRARVPVFLALFLALVFPMILRLPKEIATGFAPGADLREAMGRLRELMPPPCDPYGADLLDPRARPPGLAGAESVLTFWSQGHYVTYFAERPVVADNFGYNYLDSLRFFLAENEDQALSIARAHRVRFVLALDLFPAVESYGRVLGLPRLAVATEQGWMPTAEYFRTVQARLQEFDGQPAQLRGGLRVAPLRAFRLRYASPAGVRRLGRFIPRWKIFEVLPPEGPPASPRPSG